MGTGVQLGFTGEDHSTTQSLSFQHMERKAMARMGLLVESYHTGCWWFELLDLCRKLFLNGLIVFVGGNSAGQVRPRRSPTCNAREKKETSVVT